MKILASKNYDGLYLTDEAVKRYLEIKGVNFKYEIVKPEEPSPIETEYIVFDIFDGEEHNILYAFQIEDTIERNDEYLVKLFEEMGNKICRYDWVKFRIIEIPDDVDWFIDGNEFGEYVRECSRTWGLGD